MDALLETAAPDWVDRPITELRSALKSVDPWTHQHAQVVDYVLRSKVLAALQRSSAPEVAELHEHIRRLLPPSKRHEVDRLGDPWTARWRALADLLETHRSAVASRDPDILNRAHVADIIEVLRANRGGIPQKSIEEQLGLGKANLSRILSALESHEIIERTPYGRENRVQPGKLFPVETGPITAPQESPQPVATAAKAGFSDQIPRVVRVSSHYWERSDFRRAAVNNLAVLCGEELRRFHAASSAALVAACAVMDHCREYPTPDILPRPSPVYGPYIMFMLEERNSRTSMPEPTFSRDFVRALSAADSNLRAGLPESLRELAEEIERAT